MGCPVFSDQEFRRDVVGGKQQRRQRSGVGPGVPHGHKISHRQRRTGEVLSQHVRGAAEVSCDVYGLGDAGIPAGRAVMGKAVSPVNRGS